MELTGSMPVPNASMGIDAPVFSVIIGGGQKDLLPFVQYWPCQIHAFKPVCERMHCSDVFAPEHQGAATTSSQDTPAQHGAE